MAATSFHSLPQGFRQMTRLSASRGNRSVGSLPFLLGTAPRSSAVRVKGEFSVDAGEWLAALCDYFPGKHQTDMTLVY
jgi:hypothetical protein